MTSSCSSSAAAIASRAPAAAASEEDVLAALGGAEQSARQLADDLAALVQAGLLCPVRRGGELRFVETEPAEREA